MLFRFCTYINKRQAKFLGYQYTLRYTCCSHAGNTANSAKFFALCTNAKAYLKKIMQSLPLIEAAGGIVKNTDGAYLFIYRLDKWDLPKGKIEKGEKTKEAAVREVEEECGITVTRLGTKVC